MADETRVGKRVLFDEATLDAAQTAASERGMTLHRLVGLAVEDFLGRLLPADQIVWTRTFDISQGTPPAAWDGEANVHLDASDLQNTP